MPEDLSDPKPLVSVPAIRWVYPADPLCVPTSVHFSTLWPRLVSTPRLDEDSTVWLSVFLGIDNGPFRVALSRIRSSLAEPRTWEDALVDAVIAWEALSGDCRQAMTMKISAVLARLTAEQRHRQELRKTLTNIYKVRSRVVHGAAIDQYDDVRKARDQAALVAIVAAKRLAEDFPELLGVKDLFDRLYLD